MKKGYLKEAFTNSAAVGFFVDHSQWLSSWPFMLGYAGMIASDPRVQENYAKLKGDKTLSKSAPLP